MKQEAEHFAHLQVTEGGSASVEAEDEEVERENPLSLPPDEEQDENLRNSHEDEEKVAKSAQVESLSTSMRGLFEDSDEDEFEETQSDSKEVSVRTSQGLEEGRMLPADSHTLSSQEREGNEATPSPPHLPLANVDAITPNSTQPLLEVYTVGSPPQNFFESSKRLITARLPSVIKVQKDEYMSSPEDQKGAVKEDSMLDDSRLRGNLHETGYTLCWRRKKDRQGNFLFDPNTGENILESNTKLVKWSNGSHTLFIGSEAFECQIREDKTYLFEDSQDELKLLHAIARERCQIRAAHIMKDGLKRSTKAMQLSKQRTKLTTHREAEDAQRIIQEALENRRDAESLRKRQHALASDKGLTRAFLEAEDSESEDETSISRIKERYKRSSLK